MIDFRFTGRFGSGADTDPCDIRFRTDALSASDGTFNITQIQDGQTFSTSDKQSYVYRKWFWPLFREQNTTLGAMTQFAIDNDLDLRAYDKDGNFYWIVNDDSASAS